ncbi:MAG: anthranilate synthase component I family protein [Patescibacteria group bacterium]|jgi:anthranilate synthase component 1
MTLPKIKLKNKKPSYIKFAEDADFFELFKKIEENFEDCFILESLGEEGGRSRYHVIGFGPEAILAAAGNELSLTNCRAKNGKIETKKFRVENPYYALRKIVPNNVISRQYAGGLIGYIAYEGMNYFEPAINLAPHKNFSQFKFGVYTDGLVYDKMTGESFYFHYGQNRAPLIKKMAFGKKGGGAAVKNSGPKKLKVKFIRDTKTKKEHEAMVKRIKKDITEGKIFQCVAGFKSEFEIRGDDILIYESLRKVNPSPHMFYLKFGPEKIIGASPELLFRLREGEMETFPLAGTAARGTSRAEDLKLTRRLLSDPKEIAEHSMLIDLHRNDIGRVARFGSVKVKNAMDVKKFSHVQHISSEVAGIIREGEDAFSALAANFPAGTLTGAPKIEAMKIIEREENEARGPYGGAVGHFGFSGECTFAIPIRSLFIYKNKGYAQTGGGIVYDSKPGKEYAEIKSKLFAMKKVLKEFE